MNAVEICRIDGCGRGGKIVRKLCGRHYQRQRASGELALIQLPTVEERFVAGLERKANGCLEWTGATNDSGYGILTIARRPVRTHRIAWERVHGPIVDGLNVLHHCDNPPCCDAVDTEHHLFLGTKADNAADMAAKGRSYWSAKTHCPANHAYDEGNTIVDKQGRRHCRTCNNIRSLARYHRNRAMGRPR